MDKSLLPTQVLVQVSERQQPAVPEAAVEHSIVLPQLEPQSGMPFLQGL